MAAPPADGTRMRARTALVLLALVAGVLATGSPATADPPAVGDTAVFDTDQGFRYVDDAVIGPDGAWWGIRDDKRIVRIDAAGEIDLFDSPLQTNNGSDIVPGADDALWVWASGASTYVRVTTDGTVTSHPNPVAPAAIREVAAHPDGTIWVLTPTAIVRVATDGSVAGTLPLPADPTSELVIAPNGDALTLIDGSLVRVAPSGDLETTPLPGLVHPSEIAVLPDGTVFVGSSDPGVVAEVTDDGLDVIALGVSSVWDLVVAPDGSVWAHTTGEVFRIDDEGGVTTADLPDGTWAASLSVGADGRMWASGLNVLHRVAADGSVETELLGVANPFMGAAGPDGQAWIGGFLDGHVARISPAGELEVVADVGQAYYGMATGPDGNLWVTGGDLYRVTTAGEVTAFPLPGIEDAWDIDVGPDGNLWVVDRGGAVGRVGLDGTITVYPLPLGFGEPFRIAAGGDGNLWVNELDGKDVARVAPDGTIDVFSMPVDGSVASIATDPNGAIWMVHDGESLVRVAPSGVATPVPTPGFHTMALTSAPDGNLWMAGLDEDGGAVGQLTPDGQLTVHPAPDVGRTAEVFATPDGYVWVPNACCFGRREGHSVLRVAIGIVDVTLDVAEESIVTGDEVHASVTVTNTGSTALTEIALSSDDLPACAADVPDLGPGEEHTVTCTDALDVSDPVVTVDTAETQPKTAADVVDVSPLPTCLGRDVTVDLNRGHEPTAGPDVVLGTPGDDVIATLGGGDTVCAGAGDDEVLGGGGRDTIAGGGGRDTIDGGIGDDELSGEVGADVLAGLSGFDHLDGGDGVDTLRGGANGDHLAGGPNRDTCAGDAGEDEATSCELLSGVP